MSTHLRISQLAERSGYRPSTLRFYDEVGLLPATGRTAAGYRLYDEAAVARLRFIDRAKQLGLPLPEIRELVEVWDGGACAHVQDRLRADIAARSAQVRAQMGELTALAQQLAAAAEHLTGGAPDEPCADGCGCTDEAPADDAVTGPSVPVACTLGAPDQPGRLAEWRELLAHVQRREPLDGGLRLTFPPDPALAGQLAGLAVREQACCSFFTFTLRPTTAALQLDVTAPDEAVGVVADMFGPAA